MFYILGEVGYSGKCDHLRPATLLRAFGCLWFNTGLHWQHGRRHLVRATNIFPHLRGRSIPSWASTKTRQKWRRCIATDGSSHCHGWTHTGLKSKASRFDFSILCSADTVILFFTIPAFFCGKARRNAFEVDSYKFLTTNELHTS